MKKAVAAMVVAVLLAISASSALAGGGGWAVRVKGGGRALVTWGTFRSTSSSHVDLPWRHSVRIGSGFEMVTISGQRESGGPGRIVCTILHGGVVMARDVASGPNAVCTTSVGAG
jgi:opacity protein-like surface antigen